MIPIYTAHRDVQCSPESLIKLLEINVCFINNICSFGFIKTWNPNKSPDGFVVVDHRLGMAVPGRE